jgi:hypothetical protein
MDHHHASPQRHTTVTTEPDDEGIWVVRIAIERRLHDDGTDNTWTQFEDRDGNMPPLVEILGLLRLAEDTAIRQAMGEIPDDEDDDE